MCSILKYLLVYISKLNPAHVVGFFFLCISESWLFKLRFGYFFLQYFNIYSAICDVRGGIDKVAGQVGFSAERVINAINAGDCQISRQLSECCCNVRDAITRQGYENQLATVNQTNTLQSALNFVNSSVERGFAQTNYDTAQQTCELKNAIAAQTQVINDKFCQLEMREMAREIQQLRDERNAYQLSAS